MKKVGSVWFGLLSPDIIRKMSVTQVITADTYDEDGLPISSGLMDPKLGTIEPGQRCKTCGNRVGECPGHFGHIELARPVVHVSFAKLIKKFLKAICRRCARLKIKEESIPKLKGKMDAYVEKWGQLDQEAADETLKEAGKATTCPHCEAEQYKIKFEKPTTFYEEKMEGSVRLTPTDVRDRLERISSEDAYIMGIDTRVTRPEWMILTVMPVPPVAVRPSITLESGVKSEDDLTHKLVDVIRINQRLRENIEAGAPQLIVEDLWELLQYHVTTYFNNEVSGIPPARHRSGRALRTLAQRLKGKEGRFRSNLSGKRVDFSARTVISPDPNLSINEVGVPTEIAQTLTVPERVTEWNIEDMRELVLQGPHKYPGCNYIVRPDGKRIDLRYVKDRQTNADGLAPGYIIERHLRPGDIVLFNRQPSLHRMSIMAHEVKVMPYRTFRLNLCVCLSGDTEVFTDVGRVPIKELVENFKEYSPLSCEWDNGQKPYFSGLVKNHTINPRQIGLKCFQIITENGRVIKATQEHPFYTNLGQIQAGSLKVGDSLAVYPIELPLIGGSPLVLTEEQILDAIPDDAYPKYTLKTLGNLELMDVPAGSKKQIQIASLVGHLFGDGSLIISREGGRVIFRAATPEDIQSLWSTAHELNLQPGEIKEFISSPSEITSATGDTETIQGKVLFFEIRRKPIAIAFKALGVPVGDRVVQEYRLPQWLMTGPQTAKRAFLRAYFGAELSTPRLHTTSKVKFNQPVFKIAKINGISPSKFIQDIKKLLHEFGVTISSVKKVRGNLRRDGTISIIHHCNIGASDGNLLNLFRRIGYEFAQEKEELARLAGEYILTKNRAKAKATAQLQEAIQLRKQGLSYSAIAKELHHQSWNTVASWILNNRTSAGLPASFPDFPEWCKSSTKGLQNGFVWDKIKTIDEIDLPVAYDITTDDNNHNFVAAEFLTKNCPPYNADFDGDEMNLHVPQGEEARAEARILMLVQEQILSPRYGGPIIGGIQDYISSAFLLTQKHSFFNKRQTCQLLAAANYKGDLPPPAIVHPQQMWSGKQIFSMLLPKGLNLSLKAKVCQKCDVCKKELCDYDAYVFIRDGQLLAGVIDKKAIGAAQPESVLHRIAKDYGNSKAREFLDSICPLLVTLITNAGFSMGIDDVILSPTAIRQIEQILSDAEKEGHRLVQIYENDQLQRLPGRSLEETFEMKMIEILARARDRAGEVAGQNLGMDKHAVIMTATGAKGNPLNLAQMAACVGQQAVRGQRISRGYRQRTLPHFQQGDLSPQARGFVVASYRRGLNPIEFFFHAMGGREGLVDTAVRTSTSGYMQRRLINALQDIKVEYDGTVRNSNGDIIQFQYGEDGVDPARSDHGKAVNLDVIIERILTEEK